MSTKRNIGVDITSCIAAAELGFCHATSLPPLAHGLEYLLALLPGAYGAVKYGATDAVKTGAAGAAAGAAVDAIHEHGHLHKESLVNGVKRGAEAGAAGGFAYGALYGGFKCGWPAIAGYAGGHVIGEFFILGR